MTSQPQTILKSVFGYDQFRGSQEEIIEHLVAGGDALVIMPTGAGKSLCYQIPAIIREGVGIIVSPLIALMRDQVEALKLAGVRAAFLNSSLTPGEGAAIKSAARRGELDLLYVAPERVMTEEFQSLLTEIRVSLFAIDEAHCVSQWGHDFRPEYLQLSVLHERYPNVPRIAVTATADGQTRREIITKLELNAANIYLGGFDRPNIKYQVTFKQSPRTQLLRFLKQQPSTHSGIVYCLSRKKTEETAAFLTAEGFKAFPYHAGLDTGTKDYHQDIFLKEEGIIIVATIAFGMGIDKPDVRFVCHLDLPKSIESYYQETGRAGRDGEPALAWMLYGMGDVVTMKQMIEGSDAGEERKRLESRKLNELLGYCETTLCRRHVLLKYFGEQSGSSCGNCDTCLLPVETWDGTKAAQMALSCVYRTGQRFGAQYLITVLRGSLDDERVTGFGHDRLSTFGIGKEISQGEWHSVFRQLIAAGYLTADQKGYGSLILTPESKKVLQGEVQLWFRRDPTPTKDKAKGERRRQDKYRVEITEEHSDYDQPLFEALRKCRLELAKTQGVPPYVIFHDRTLREIAARVPQSAADLLEVSGVGESKLARYGDAFLSVIREHQSGSVPI